MARKLLQGIKSVKIGDPGADGGMGTVLAAVGKLINDSVVLTFDEPQKNPVTTEDLTAPLVVLTDPNVNRKFEFSTYDYDVSNLAKWFGGTVATGKWDAPTEFSSITQSVEITSKDVDGVHYLIEIPMANISASMTGKLSKNGLGEIKITAEVLTPFDASGNPLAPVSITEVSA